MLTAFGTASFRWALSAAVVGRCCWVVLALHTASFLWALSVAGLLVLLLSLVAGVSVLLVVGECCVSFCGSVGG